MNSLVSERSAGLVSTCTFKSGTSAKPSARSKDLKSSNNSMLGRITLGDFSNFFGTLVACSAVVEIESPSAATASEERRRRRMIAESFFRILNSLDPYDEYTDVCFLDCSNAERAHWVAVQLPTANAEGAPACR